jgi:polyphosphate kinase
MEYLGGNLRVVGIIDRFLEHSRILIFCNGGKEKYFVGSADWMTRNLLSRIEVMTPVLDDDIKVDLLRTVEYGLGDTTNGHIVDGRGTDMLQPGEPFRSQEQLYNAYLAEESAASHK